MKLKSLLDSINVPLPCPQSWDEMTGNDKSRFCHHCEKDIHNLSEMTPREVQKLMSQSKEGVCIRMEREPDGKIKTLKKQLHQITRQVPIAAGVLTASLILSATVNAQSTTQPSQTGKIIITQSAKSGISKPAVSGEVTDPNGAVIPNVKIILRDTKNDVTRNAVSDSYGFYEFKDVAPSVYEIEVAEYNGFKRFNYNNLTTANDKILNLRIVLEPVSPTTIGVSFIPEEGSIKTEQTSINNEITPRKLEDLPLNADKIPVIGLVALTNFPHHKKVADKTSQVSFKVANESGKVAPKAEVKLINQKNKQEFTLSTDNEGIALFNSIPHGKYQVETAAPNFDTDKRLINAKNLIEPTIKIILNEIFIGKVGYLSDYGLEITKAAAYGNLGGLQKLISAGENINKKDKKYHGMTALHLAAQDGDLELLEFLLKVKAKINIIDYDNDTPLMLAAEENHLDFVRALLKAGANPNFKNKKGKTAFDLAANDDIKKLLNKYKNVR